MGVREDPRPLGGLDGLYGVQLAGRSMYSDDEAVKTSIMDPSARELQEGVGTSRRLLIRRLWQQRPPCLRPIHCSLSSVGGFSRSHWDNGGKYFKANKMQFSDCNKESYFLILAASIYHVPSNSQTTVTFSLVPQVSFAKRASTEPELRMAHNLHKMSSLLGGALFIADDAFPETPYLHAAWHLAAALGVGTCNKLLE
uniref:Uncharacterized protein n=1 Tax=Oryza punctata TaxID=4537 RepID=A0A0E0LV57_ORYPU